VTVSPNFITVPFPKEFSMLLMACSISADEGVFEAVSDVAAAVRFSPSLLLFPAKKKNKNKINQTAKT
jgi:hypothetical protein